jgi:hypothetical protein
VSSTIVVLSEKVAFKEQHMSIKFCFKLTMTTTEIHKMLKLAFGNKITNRTETIYWISTFKI